jgi:hypothetical protein
VKEGDNNNNNNNDISNNNNKSSSSSSSSSSSNEDHYRGNGVNNAGGGGSGGDGEFRDGGNSKGVSEQKIRKEVALKEDEQAEKIEKKIEKKKKKKNATPPSAFSSPLFADPFGFGLVIGFLPSWLSPLSWAQAGVHNFFGSAGMMALGFCAGLGFSSAVGLVAPRFPSLLSSFSSLGLLGRKSSLR